MVTQTPILTLQGVVVRKRGKVLLGPTDITINSNGFSVVMGPNGSGKTTLLRLLHGLEKTKAGSIIRTDESHINSNKQAIVFQTPTLLRRDVISNLIYPLAIKGVQKREALLKAESWLDRVGLTKLTNAEAHLLSGGEKQKLALARALIVEPNILLLDEPTTNLDGQSTREIETLLKQVQETGVKIIMATHDIGQAKRLADDVLFLYQGKLHEQTSAKKFFKSADTSEAQAFIKGDIVE